MALSVDPPETDLAYHAVYIIEPDGTILYRKIARRRTRSPELLHALDGDAVACCASRCTKGEPVCRSRCAEGESACPPPGER